MSNTVSTVDIIFNGRDKFSGVSKRVGAELTGIGTKARAMGATFGDVGNRIRGMFSGIGATVATFGMGMGSMIKTAMGAEMRMARLANATQMSSSEVANLQSQIFAVSNGIQINADDTLAALEQITEKTGNIQFATDNLNNMALAIAATGASGEAMGAVFSDMNEKFGLTNADEVMNTISTLNEQGKAGAFTLKELATLGNRVMSAYASTGRSGTAGLLEMGAALQVIRKGTGSADQAATAFESVLEDIQDPSKIAMIAELGVSVKDAAGAMRPITDIMVDITDKAGDMGDAGEILNTIFGRQSKRAFNALLVEKKKLGNEFKNNNPMKDFMNVQGTSNQLMEDAARASGTLQGALNKLLNIWDQFSINAMNGGAGKVIADFIASLDTQKVLSFLDVFSKIALGFVVFVAVVKTAMAVTTLYKETVILLEGVMAAFAIAQNFATVAMIAFSAANPFVLILAGVVAVVGVVILLVKYWDDFVGVLKTAWGYVEKIWNAFADFMGWKTPSATEVITGATTASTTKSGNTTAAATPKQTAQQLANNNIQAQSASMASTPSIGQSSTKTNNTTTNNKLQILIKVDGQGKASVIQQPEGMDVHVEQQAGNTIATGGF